MKLFNFTFIDKHNLPISRILELAHESADDEATLRDWTGYTVTPCKDPEHLPQGEVHYFFEINGNIQSGTSEEPHKKTTKTVSSGKPDAAASPA